MNKKIISISLGIALGFFVGRLSNATEKPTETDITPICHFLPQSVEHHALQCRTLVDRLSDIKNANEKNHPDKSLNIYILGAGMAGIVSAHELKKLGHNVTVFEASDRFGGRVWTHKFKNGQYHELGAMRIPESHDYTNHYIKECGLECRDFITAHQNQNCFYNLRGETWVMKDSHKVIDKYDLSPQEKFIAEKIIDSRKKKIGAPALFGIHVTSVINSLTQQDILALFGETLPTQRIAELDNLSLGEFINQRLKSEDAKELIGSVVGSGLEGFFDRALTMFLRDEIVGNGLNLKEIVGGTEELPKALVEKNKLKSIIKTNHEIVSIELLDGNTKFKVKSWNEEKKEYEVVNYNDADYVICTIPFSVLRGISITGLSNQKMRSIRNLHYGSSTKVLLNCKRFWETNYNIFGGASITDGISRSTYYPSDNYPSENVEDSSNPKTKKESVLGNIGKFEPFRGSFTQSIPHEKVVQKNELTTSQNEEPGDGVLVGCYNWGADALRLGLMPEKKAFEAVVNSIEKFHPEIKDYLVKDENGQYEYKVWSWDKYEWSLGAFCFMQPNDLRDYYHAAIRSEGNLHFAGEHCSLDQAWIQGALSSAIRVVEEIANSKTTSMSNSF